ncbi:MAG: hypothetical protein NXI32_26105, partial [bacterium]|nr:hypothetical protein [bacterium]
IAWAWWPTSKDSLRVARDRLSKLVAHDLLVHARVITDKTPALDSPVASWKPGQQAPDFGQVAWVLHSRWPKEITEQSVYYASKSTARLFGGKAQGKLAHRSQASHDLGVSQMYLQLRQAQPEQLQYWIGEDMLAPHRRGQKLPDAILASAPSATPKLVLEFGGAYDKQRLINFHNDCFYRSLPYEIW